MPDRLLDGGELAVEDACAGQPLHVGKKAWPEPGQRIQLLFEEQIERTVKPACPHQLGALDISAEEKVVGTAASDRDPDPVPVDILDSAEGRARRHEVGRLDLGVRCGERDRLGAGRLRADEADVPHAVGRRVRELGWAWRMARRQSARRAASRSPPPCRGRPLPGPRPACVPVTSRKFARLIAARRVPLGASSDRTSEFMLCRSDWRRTRFYASALRPGCPEWSGSARRGDGPEDSGPMPEGQARGRRGMMAPPRGRAPSGSEESWRRTASPSSI